MTTDLILAVLHHLAVFSLFSFIVAEWMLMGAPVTPKMIRRLAVIDLHFGLVAALVVVIGVLRVMYGLRGAAFYLGNPFFWAKISLFIVIGLISIVPTLRIRTWRNLQTASAQAIPNEADVRTTRRLVLTELVLAFGLPVLAAFMARGVGS